MTEEQREQLEQSITERITAAAMEAAGKLDAGDDKRSIILVVPVVVFSNVAAVNGV